MPPPAVSSNDLVAAITALQLPLVFLDTAAILDIPRVPYRQELQADIIESAAAMIEDSVANPRRLWVVTTANVLREFEEHRRSVQQELEARISNLNQSISRLSRVARIIFPERRISHFEWLESTHPTLEQRVLEIMDRLIESIIVFRGTAECIGKARDRLWGGLPPASKSKQEFKDCEIFEEFLELVSALRKQGFNKLAVFVTPNKGDYGPPPYGHEKIASDLEVTGAIYTATIAWAYAEVKRMAS